MSRLTLTALQEASRDHILDVFENKKKCPSSTTKPRYLLADEVGLGKTVTTAGVIKEMAAKKKNKPFIVYYVCGNERVTMQNKRNLEEKCGAVPTEDERLTMQDLNKIPNSGIYILPLTPAVHFTFKGSKHHDEEAKAMCTYVNSQEKNLPKNSDLIVTRNLFASTKHYYAKHGIDGEYSAALADSFLGLRREMIKHLASTTLKPDLIILDEFQNYGEILEEYSKSTYPCFDFIADAAPMLLLSATPFDVKAKDVKVIDGDIEESEKTSNGGGSDYAPFLKSTEESFKIVFKFVTGVAYEETKHGTDFLYNHFFCRTQRDLFYGEELQANIFKEHRISYAQALSHLRYEKNLITASEGGLCPSANRIRKLKYAKLAPSFLNFSRNYKNVRSIEDETYFLKKDNGNLDTRLNSLFNSHMLGTGNEIQGYHAGYGMIRDEALPVMEKGKAGVETMLWIPPTISHLDEAYKTDNNPFWVHKNYTKTLTFATFRMSTASIPYFLCQEKENRLTRVSEEFKELLIESETLDLYKKFKEKIQTVKVEISTQEGIIEKNDYNKNYIAKIQKDAQEIGNYGGLDTARSTLQNPTLLTNAKENIRKYIDLMEQLPQNVNWEKDLKEADLKLVQLLLKQEETNDILQNPDLGLDELEQELSLRKADDSYWDECFSSQSDEKVKGFIENLLESNIKMIQAVTGLTGGNEKELAKKRYVRMGELKEVLDEYAYIGGLKDFVTAIKDPTKVNVYQCNDNPEKRVQSYELGFAERFTRDNSDGGANSLKHETYLQTMFNSPFYPFVMVAPSTAQEGLDFHNYCHRFVHYSIPSSPVVFIQREGRVDRYHSHLLRKRLFALCSFSNNPSFSDMESLFSCATQLKQNKMEANHRHLFPHWFVGEKDFELLAVKMPEDLQQFSRHVWACPLSDENKHFDQILKSTREYETYLGNSYKSEAGKFCPLLRSLSGQ